MKVFSFAGIIFNADNVCTIQKVNLKKETERSEEKNPKKTPAFEMVPGLQVVTIAGGVNFTFENEKERDEKFNELLKGLGEL